MKQIIARILAAIFGAPTAAAEVAHILSSFTDTADKLAVAAEKARGEINASYVREDVAYQAYLAAQDVETAVRQDAREARAKADRAAQNIRALVEV